MSIENTLATDLQSKLEKDAGLRQAMRSVERQEGVKPVYISPKQAVLVRAAEALHRIEQITIALERAADDFDKQLAAVKGRL
jgi:hypothetical protein